MPGCKEQRDQLITLKKKTLVQVLSKMCIALQVRTAAYTSGLSSPISSQHLP